MQDFLKEGERIDDLQIRLPNGKDLKILQNPSWFCFGVDAVLLASFAKIKKGARVLDFCTGNGVIPLLLAAKSKAEKIIGVEIQEKVAEMASRSVQMNGLQEKIEIIPGDLRTYSGRDFDVITCNPPYKEAAGGLISGREELAIARTEIHCTLHDVIASARKMLKPNGSLFFIHRPERLADIFYFLRQQDIEPKVLRFIQPTADKAPTMVLIQAMRCARPKLLVEKPLIIYDKDGRYTEEIQRIYGISS